MLDSIQVLMRLASATRVYLPKESSSTMTTWLRSARKVRTIGRWDRAVAAYQHALELDPDVFQRTSRVGVQAQLPSPEDRARYDYTVAKLYAKMGFSDQSLEYLKRAMEAGYKDLKNVYKDAEFAELRKNPRFTELMASKAIVIAD